MWYDVTTAPKDKSICRYFKQPYSKVGKACCHREGQDPIIFQMEKVVLFSFLKDIYSVALCEEWKKKAWERSSNPADFLTSFSLHEVGMLVKSLLLESYSTAGLHLG